MPKTALKCLRPVLAVVVVAVAALAGAQEGAEYEVGGPLAGLKLPRDPNMHSRVQLYPGSVEHYRAYMTKYLPVRSFFDRQSMLQNWVVPNLPGAEGRPFEQYASPVYHQPDNGVARDTGKKLPPVPVLRCSVKKPVFALDLGTREAGLYAVRIIGAVETARLRRFREPLYIAMKVNDGLQGEVSTYRIRVGYVDEFFSISEIYFHAPEKRHFKAELYVDEGSKVDVLVHNITLDDVLAGCDRRPVKRATTLASPESIEAIQRSVNEVEKKRITAAKPLAAAERLARDQAMWSWLPPINAQGSWLDMNVPLPGVEAGTAELTAAEIEAKFGKWEDAHPAALVDPRRQDFRDPDLFLVNKRLGLSYGIRDLRAHRPLPDPFPIKDDGAGLFYPDPNDPARGRMFDAIALAVGRRYRGGYGYAGAATNQWLATGNDDAGRDAAIALIAFAYTYPTLDAGNWLHALVAQPGAYERDLRNRMREECSRWMPGYPDYLHPLYIYDKLLPYIKGNEALAQSVSRFVPRVKTSDDLIMLLDAYLVQHAAKRIMRYHDHTHEMAAFDVATILGDKQSSAPLLEWVFDRTFIYPLNPEGIQNLMVTATDRNGAQYIGSTYYAQGEGGEPIARTVDRYVKAGGDPRFAFDLAVYPKPLAHCYWELNIVLGGCDFARIGDVTGPDKRPGATLGNLAGMARAGWRWSKDPRFAWILAYMGKAQDETSKQWDEIVQAAATVPRAPWLDLRSRQVSNWFGALESGLQHDDYRFRRALAVRTGMGIGHEHYDTLDLQLFAHGLPTTIDDGQRSGYVKPNSRFSRIHNTVEINGGHQQDGGGTGEFGLRSHAWVRSLSDGPGARYLLAQAVPPPAAKYVARQVALVDVDEGRGSQRLPPAQQRPDAALPKDVTTANSYVFDVFRVSGGKMHTYCFHGPISDEVQWNARGAAPLAPAARPNYNIDSEADYLSFFNAAPESCMAGDCPETFEVTWRYSRDGKSGSEQRMAGGNFDPALPRKFTRLHLFEADGSRALRGNSKCIKDPISYEFTNVFSQRKGQNLESAFMAVIEPYVGEPFIAQATPLKVADNQGDALKAVALHIKTTNGHDDICFADGYPDKLRSIGEAQVSASGEWAIYSTDVTGLRQAGLTGGTVLEAPELKLRLPQRQRTGKVVQVDYLKRQLRIDTPWIGAAPGSIFEIGTFAKDLASAHLSSYTIAGATVDGNGTLIRLGEGADTYRSRITGVDSGEKSVSCRLAPSLGTVAGFSKNVVVSNDSMTRFWRGEQRGARITLDGPVSAADLGPENVVRLWEYGIGDSVRQSTFAALRRVSPDVFELSADVALQLSLKAQSLEISADGKTWQPAATKAAGAWLTLDVPAEGLAGKPLYLRKK